MPQQDAGNVVGVELPDVMPARHPGLEIAEFDSALVVFDADANQVHLLQQVHALVFDSCPGGLWRVGSGLNFFWSTSPCHRVWGLNP